MAGPYTASELGTASAVHTGLQVNGGVVTISATTTAAALVYLCRVPNGATIVDWVLYLNEPVTVGGANQKIVIGTSASHSGLGAFSLSGSASSDPLYAKGRFQPQGTVDLMPVRISLSDDQGIDQKVWLTAKFEVAPSTSNSVIIAKFYVTYTMDGLTGHTTIR